MERSTLNFEGSTPAHSPAEIEQLRASAEERSWYAPRRGWELAQAAYAAAQLLGQDLLQAECALTLALALNVMGRFADAVPLLHTAREFFTAHGPPQRAARCGSELVLAYSYLGQFDAAQAALSRARESLASLDDPLVRAYCDRAEGVFYHWQNRYSEAVALLCRAADAFAAADREGEAALIWCDLAQALRYVDPQQALVCLDKTRRIPALEESSFHAARCDYILAVIYEELNRYAEGLALHRQARLTFAHEDLEFLTALCDLGQGVDYYYLNQFDESLQACSRARASFTAQGLTSYVTLCDLNIAVVFYAINRYTEALALWERVAEEALAEGRALRAARCHTNMGLCYDRLGRYDLALVLHNRAREAFLEAGSPIYAALCQENLAGTCRRLGRYKEALEHYRQAREIFTGQGMQVYVARCDTHLADLYLVLSRYAEALACLEQARATCEQQSMAVHVAVCEREMARVLVEMDQGDKALTLLASARAVLADKGLVVDAALCDLAIGEVVLGQGEHARAALIFETTRPLLTPSFPDAAWRAEFGLSRCALARGDLGAALEHGLLAVEMVTEVRANLSTERLSGSFFADRRQVYEETLKLALRVGAVEPALAVVEASKTQTYLTWTGFQNWREVTGDDPHLVQLLHKAETLSQEMDVLRRKLRLVEPGEAGPILRGEGEVSQDQPQALARLAELSQAYEAVIERLRLAMPNLLEARHPKPFSVQALRQAAAGWLPARWACLAYHLFEDTLVTFYLDPRRLQAYTRPLSAYDRLALRQCTSTENNFRELIYRGTIRGYPAPGAPGPTLLGHLYSLLIPPEIDALDEIELLIVAPHGVLHGLPFQALLAENAPLVTRVPLVYVPSLNALQALLEQGSAPQYHRTLVCGVSDCGSRARPLPRVAEEIAAIQAVLGESVDVLGGAEATRKALLRLNETGVLAGYDVIHFATHAVPDRLAPSQSRVLLADGDLTLADILNLKLGPCLVVLSACEGAMGDIHPGDEVMGLARAFFFAGAKSVIASLWPAEDTSTAELMARFYQQRYTGKGVVEALSLTQIEMFREGYVAYQWAPFITIGLP